MLRARENSLNYTIERLCTTLEDYTSTGIHYHDIISAYDMYSYFVQSSEAADGEEVTVAGTVEWWFDWLPGLTNWKFQGDYIAYDISDYTIAKR